MKTNKFIVFIIIMFFNISSFAEIPEGFKVVETNHDNKILFEGTLVDKSIEDQYRDYLLSICLPFTKNCLESKQCLKKQTDSNDCQNYLYNRSNIGNEYRNCEGFIINKCGKNPSKFTKNPKNLNDFKENRCQVKIAFSNILNTIGNDKDIRRFLTTNGSCEFIEKSRSRNWGQVFYCISNNENKYHNITSAIINNGKSIYMIQTFFTNCTDRKVIKEIYDKYEYNIYLELFRYWVDED